MDWFRRDRAAGQQASTPGASAERQAREADAMLRGALQVPAQLEQAAQRCLHSMHIAILEVSSRAGAFDLTLGGSLERMRGSKALADDVQRTLVAETHGVAGRLQRGSAEASQALKTTDRAVQEVLDALACARQATEKMDLSSVQQSFHKVSTDSESQLAQLSGRIGESLATMNGLLDGISSDFDQLRSANRVIAETVPELARRAHTAQQRVTDSTAFLGELQAPLQQDLAGRPPALAEVLRRHHLPLRDDDDLLEAVLRRGQLRVAVDPSFVGLSFRLKPGAPLQGMDIAYASAFAQSLGVGIEFVEQNWDQCLGLPHHGRSFDEAPVDVVWSALPPMEDVRGLAYSRPYTRHPLVLARRRGDVGVSGLADLAGRVLGCGYDLGAMQALEAAGVRWEANRHRPGGRITLGNLVSYPDPKLIYDALVQGKVDAFFAERPIFHWAATHPGSPWSQRIELVPNGLIEDEVVYVAGVKDAPGSASLLARINGFIEQFEATETRAAIERLWQGAVAQ